jgi:formylglycine-generating enzyme required for sulfatase activity
MRMVPKASRQFIYFVCLMLASALFASAQLRPDVTPEKKPPASLKVTTDLGCDWTLDGVSHGRLKAGNTMTVQASPGKHQVQAPSSDGQVTWQSSVTVAQTGQKALQIPLSSVRAKQEKETSERGRKAQYPTNLRFEFVRIAPGEFDMGCSPGDSDCSSDEKPQHQVRISKGFEIGKYLVTQAMWESVMGSNPSHFKGADRPVENVSWNDVQEFLQRLNTRNDGYRYRLPTEAEWEYAARAGSKSARYGELNAVAWYDDNSGKETHPEGQKQPNAWGLYDMLGNVWEWVQDWYSGSYYQQSPGTDPQGPSSGSSRVLRGGSWDYIDWLVRASYRLYVEPGNRYNNFGFRCVREAVK